MRPPPALMSPLRNFPRYLLWLALSAGLAVLSAAESPPTPMPAFRQLAPLPSIREAAVATKIDLGGIAPALGRETLHLGDTVVALVSFTEKEKLQQWLIELTAVEPTAEEKKQKGEATVLYTTTGNELRFGSEKVSIAIRTIGPLTAADATRKAAATPTVKAARATADAAYLALGLDRLPALMERMKEKRTVDPNLPSMELGMRSTPYAAEVVAKNRPAAQAAGVAAADEKGMIGSIYALMQFFQIASSTPGLQDVVSSVVDIPWWSIIRSGGKMPDIGINAQSEMNALDPVPWGLAKGTATWSIGYQLSLNTKPALNFQLAVTAPRPPLLPCAGIVGLAAARPDGKGPVLTLQIITARGAER